MSELTNSDVENEDFTQIKSFNTTTYKVVSYYHKKVSYEAVVKSILKQEMDIETN